MTATEEDLYFRGASTHAAMEHYADAALLGDVATILLDCGLRPEECFRLRPQNVADGMLEIHYGKTDNARRRIPMTPRVKSNPRYAPVKGKWQRMGLPGPDEERTYRTINFEKAAPEGPLAEGTRILREESKNEDVEVTPFELYTLRHTCLTRWAPH